jgi:GAF domain-containing protein
VVEDVTTDRQFEPCSEIMRQANVRAVQSIPMLSSNGALVGVLSIHFPQVYRPTEIELRNLEYAAHIAADAFVPL